jgi:phospholipase D1/2
MEKNSGVTFLEAQAALARIWLGESYGQPNVQEKVSIKIPQETQEGVVEASKESNKKIEEVRLPKTMDEAKAIVRRFEHGSDNIRDDENVSDSVAQHMLHDRTSLLDEMWLGTEAEERAALVALFAVGALSD